MNLQVNLPQRRQETIGEGYLWQDELFFGQCDGYLNVKMSTLLEHLVTASSQHLRSFGMTYPVFLGMGRAFVLVRCTYQFFRMPKCFELLTVKTWIDGMKGPYYRRVAQWEDENQVPVVICRSEWVVIDTETRMICKPDKDDSIFQKKSPLEFLPCEKVKIPLELTDNFLDLGKCEVKWSDVDGNAHLHSSKYVDMIWDCMPEFLRSIVLKKFSLELQKESVIGDVISISGLSIDANTYYIEGKCGGNPTFKAKFSYE